MPGVFKLELLNADIAEGRQSGGRYVESSFYRTRGKRYMDVLLAVLLLPMILPVVGVLMAIIRMDGGPGLFGHKRVGQNGKTFRCWKLRTMVVDAEDRLKRLLESDPEAAAMWRKDFKLDNDPRITRLGKFLRETSLDELPQIFNVLKGEMSFVGPRPVVTAELTRYGSEVWAYKSCVPGITGLWQVSGRNDVSYDERVQLDTRYAQKLSFSNDMKILFETAFSVASRTGK